LIDPGTRFSQPVILHRTKDTIHYFLLTIDYSPFTILPAQNHPKGLKDSLKKTAILYRQSILANNHDFLDI